MEYKKLKDLVEINSESITKNYNETIINYLDTSNITNGKIDSVVEMNIGEAPSRAKRIVRKNDIIYSTVRPNLCHYGILRETLKNMIVSTGFAVLRCKEGILPEYLYEYITLPAITMRLQAIAETSTSAYPSIKPKDLEDLDILLPPIEIQQKIANILSNIDKKIELNNKINDNLFEIALRLFNKFLDDNVEIKKIKLEECVGKINTGADAIQRAPIVDYDTGIRCIRIGDMTNNRDYHSWGFTKMTEKDFYNYKLLKNDIVITRTAVNGLTYMITNEENVVCNNGNIRLRVNDKFNPLYIYLYTKTKDFRNYIERINGETSVRPNMKVEYLTSFLIKNIDLDNQNEICKTIQPLIDKIQSNKKETFILEQLKDTLLPKLMNGEINLDKIEI